MLIDIKNKLTLLRIVLIFIFVFFSIVNLSYADIIDLTLSNSIADQGYWMATFLTNTENETDSQNIAKLNTAFQDQKNIFPLELTYDIIDSYQQQYSQKALSYPHLDRLFKKLIRQYLDTGILAKYTDREDDPEKRRKILIKLAAWTDRLLQNAYSYGTKQYRKNNSKEEKISAEQFRQFWNENETVLEARSGTAQLVPNKQLVDDLYRLYLWEFARGMLKGDLRYCTTLRQEQAKAWEIAIDYAKPEMFYAGEKTIYYNSSRLTVFSKKDGKKMWILKDDILNPPLENKDSVFLTSKKTKAFFAINADTGQELWRRKPDSNNEQVKFSPVIYKDRIIYVAGDCSFYSFSQKDGNKNWSYKAKEFLQARPAVFGNYLVFWSLGKESYDPARTLNALDVRTGKLIWSISLHFDHEYSDSDDISLFGSTETVYVNENDDVLAAIDLSTGDVKWTIQLPANKSYSKSQVIYDKETDSFLIAAGYIIGAINGDSGKYTWKTAAPEFQCKQLKSDRENAYCSTSYNGIEAFNKKTGQRNWIQFLQGYGVADMTLDKDQSLLALKSYDLYRINPNREQLTTKLKICEDNYCFAISGNNNDQKFYFYDDEKLKAVHLKFLK